MFSEVVLGLRRLGPEGGNLGAGIIDLQCQNAQLKGSLTPLPNSVPQGILLTKPGVGPVIMSEPEQEQPQERIVSDLANIKRDYMVYLERLIRLHGSREYRGPSLKASQFEISASEIQKLGKALRVHVGL
jgi:hypothetical protein